MENSKIVFIKNFNLYYPFENTIIFNRYKKAIINEKFFLIDLRSSILTNIDNWTSYRFGKFKIIDLPFLPYELSNLNGKVTVSGETITFL